MKAWPPRFAQDARGNCLSRAIKLEISGKSWKSLIKNSSWSGNCASLEVASYSTMQGRGCWPSRWTSEKLPENCGTQSLCLKIKRNIRKNYEESILINNSRLERRHWFHTKSCCFRQWPLFKLSAIWIVIKLIVAGYFSNYTNLRCCVWRWSGFIWQSSESPGTNSAWEPQINRFSLIPSTNDHCLSRFWLIFSYSCTNCWHWAWLTWLKLRGEKIHQQWQH